MTTIDEAAALDRFTQLAAIEGISGKESAIMQRIRQMLLEMGIPAHQIQFDDANSRSRIGGEVGNMIVRLPGTISGPTTLLSAHTDTVPICVGSVPERRGDEIHSANKESGLGADDRSGCAVMLTAVAELLKRNIPYRPVTLLFCVQEEIGLFGARYLNAEVLGPVNRAFNFDGGVVEKLTCGAIGGERMTITVHGIPAHAGVAPQNGASAIVMAAKAIAELHASGWLGKVDQPGLGVGTANVGVIQGGDATNVITPKVTMRAEARSHRAEVRTRIVQEIHDAFARAAASVVNAEGKSGSIEFESRVEYEAFALPEDHPSITAAENAVKAIGRTPYRMISDGGLDANWLFRHGIPAVTMGCGQKNIHTADERLVIADYLDSCRVALHLVAPELFASSAEAAS